MTVQNGTLSPAIRRIIPLLEMSSGQIDIRGGYIDALGNAPMRSAGRAQSLWLNRYGAVVYDQLMNPLGRVLIPYTRKVPERLSLERGTTVLDLGCGPGNITCTLAKAVGSGGLVVGVDLSDKMLARAVARSSPTNTGYLRANAERLPIRDASVDAANSSIMLQLVDDAGSVIDQLHRVVRPGGLVTLSVTTTGHGVSRRLTPYLGAVATARIFEPEELSTLLADRGFSIIATRTIKFLQFVDARRSQTA
ncbi:methyltransferase domain-containing protein [Fodinicola feengrottensis]|uniref:Methyltransferase domain-containing protein n=1 Tax=Fodinicola feengrottensis TaxID=435914 RepID=A0ABP4TMY5_9ACTN